MQSIKQVPIVSLTDAQKLHLISLQYVQLFNAFTAVCPATMEDKAANQLAKSIARRATA